MIRRLDWDSAFFNLEVAEWSPSETAVAIPVADVIYVKSGSAINPQIKGFENTFSEKKIIYSKHLQNKQVICNDVVSVKGTAARSELYGLAYESGKYSRFNLDKNFGPLKFRELYSAWMDNSLTGRFADDVLVYEKEGNAIGMVTYKTETDYATIGLIAVAPGQQGMGIGKKLLDCVEARLVEKKIVELRIPTQESNIPACSFYEKQGYSVMETQYIMHYWKI